jgi:hypothetical protein
VKKILFILLLLIISKIGYAQYPIVEQFDPGTTWVYTNGAGMQNYGPPENYATFNVGTTPYPDNSTITITSPVYDVSDCFSGLTVSFPLSGIVQSPNDVMSFQYCIGAGPWITVATYTGVQSTTYSYGTIPNSATQFRFILVTDAPQVVWYKPSLNGASKPVPDATHTVPVDISTEYVAFGAINVYYYDIASFTIDCSTVLPIELISFTGTQQKDGNLLKWTTATETNNNYFTIEKSNNGLDFEMVDKIKGAGNSTTIKSYSLIDRNPYSMTYYILSQTDYNGTTVKFNPIAISSAENKTLRVARITNLLGQDVPDDFIGLRIIYYSDGTTIKKIGK